MAFVKVIYFDFSSTNFKYKINLFSYFIRYLVSLKYKILSFYNLASIISRK
uniref:Uncharacterized protein n=1 Tax=Myoviridae sp. cteo515 TaxID=2823550 RepID=A0A8S5LBI0_9CAUD|nr:MAG TPA: hypothetical protein [Myoviridae sp. cteo515]